MSGVTLYPSASQILSLLDKAEISEGERSKWHGRLAEKYRGRAAVHQLDVDQSREQMGQIPGSARDRGPRPSSWWGKDIAFYQRMQEDRMGGWREQDALKDQEIGRGDYRSAAGLAEGMLVLEALMESDRHLIQYLKGCEAEGRVHRGNVEQESNNFVELQIFVQTYADMAEWHWTLAREWETPSR